MHGCLLALLTLAALGCGHPYAAVNAQRLAAPEVSIIDFGARGDGSDDRAAIQAALDAAAGGTVHIPAGTWSAGTRPGAYLCLSIPSGTTLIGDDRAGSVLQQAVGVGPAVRLLQPAGANVTIQNLTLDGQQALQPLCTMADGTTEPCEHRAGIFASNAPNLRIEHVTSRNFSGDGIYLYNHSDNFVVTDVVATGNDRDGIVLGGGTTGGVVTASTFAGNGVQQFDTEGGVVTGVTVTGNTIDAGSSSSYAMTATGSGSLTRSSGWTIAGNTINGGLELVWIDNTIVTGNHGVNPTKWPAVTLYRTTNDVQLLANSFTTTDTTTAHGSSVLVLGTGTGQATTGLIARGNTWTATGATSFGYRVEGAVSVQIWDDVITGPGIAAAGSAGIYLRATNPLVDFVLARIVHATIRNWGAYGVSVAGYGAARIDRLELAYNTFDDTGGSMRIAISPDTDQLHAAKDVCVVASTLSGGCSTLLAATPRGTDSSWGDRWSQQ